MSKRRISLVVLILVAYFMSAYASALRVVMPALGFGEVAVQKPHGDHKDFPKPGWIPRRHLPLVKLPSLGPCLQTEVSFPERRAEQMFRRVVPVLSLPVLRLARVSGSRSPPVV